MIRAYLQYWLQAGNEHSLHSPFAFDLYTRTIQVDDATNPDFAAIRTLRRELRQCRDVITITDFGAGSKVNASNQRTISDIARHTQKSDRFGRLLYRLASRFKAQTVLDLGTSLGLTTAYLAQGARLNNGQVITFEGCPETAGVARRHLHQLDTANVRLVVGNLDRTLTEQVGSIKQIDLVFFDANHQYEPTIRYFNTCLPKAHNDTVFVFDDIHWSAGMEQAWQTIKAHPDVTLTIDLFAVGLVFFRREQPKQHVILRF
ncbi:MAG: class I SAM-dependent methyltransferase [Bacteroidetes bacterium]|nr:class I SAM-dependent methyltransferase [Fibrella sp.]